MLPICLFSLSNLISVIIWSFGKNAHMYAISIYSTILFVITYLTFNNYSLYIVLVLLSSLLISRFIFTIFIKSLQNEKLIERSL